MFRSRFNRFVGLAAVAAMLWGLAMPSVVHAQEGPNTGEISWSIGSDVTTQYWFRGMAQENQGLIVQPWFEVSASLVETDDYAVDMYAGLWNSLHSGPTGADGEPGEAWYEADFYIGTAIGLPNNFTFDASYINLYSPGAGDEFAQEFDFALAYDDSGHWGETGLDGFEGLQPYVLFAIEIDGGSDNGNELGKYLELGVAPAMTVVQSEEMPVTLTVPLTVGLSLDDYYEQAAGDDATFGFFDFGLDLTMPLAFIPAEYGSWDFGVGVHGILLGSSTETIAGPSGFNVTNGDDFEVYGSMGISMSY